MAYSPDLPPHDTQYLADYVYNELARIAAAIQRVEFVHLEELNSPPERPRTGQVVFADGTNWDPGSGRGYYGYDADTPAWVKLG